MADFFEGDLDKWQPHIKTTKIPEIWRMLMDRGVRRFKCATNREAEVLLEEAHDTKIELLVAMSMYGENLEDLSQLARKYRGQRISTLTEDPEHA